SPVWQGGCGDVFDGLRVASCGSVPHTPAEGGDVNEIGVQGIRNHAVAPLEIETFDAAPGFAAVARPPGGRLEAAGVKDLRVARVDRNIVNVLVAREHIPPGTTAVSRNKDAAIHSAFPFPAAPSGQVKPFR